VLAVIFIAELAVYPFARAFGAVIGLVIFLLTAPFFLLMRRDFRRSRWLDPDSLPSEWEIAAIHDPNSINYQPPKRKRS
jgi:cell division protein FtsW (lipid II flippase)